mmetsp:Transcript_43054/g.87051  ORF Transcript_43054/g.87051 Transcript_43054/m.87051 type:complete len:206 (-) Transcript_43054:1346-1963(-)
MYRWARWAFSREKLVQLSHFRCCVAFAVFLLLLSLLALLFCCLGCIAGNPDRLLLKRLPILSVPAVHVSQVGRLGQQLAHAFRGGDSIKRQPRKPKIHWRVEQQDSVRAALGNSEGAGSGAAQKIAQLKRRLMTSASVVSHERGVVVLVVARLFGGALASVQRRRSQQRTATSRSALSCVAVRTFSWELRRRCSSSGGCQRGVGA